MLIDSLELDARRNAKKLAKSQASYNQRLSTISKTYPLLMLNPTALSLMLMSKAHQAEIEEGMA